MYINLSKVVIKSPLKGHKSAVNTVFSNIKYFCTNTKIEGRISIDDTVKDLKIPLNWDLVPRKYVKRYKDGTVKFNQTTLHHLRWMLQKDKLGQDMFLLGYPGPLRRSLAMQYLELTQRELEYIALSRDTTESDLKQRREIKNKATVYFDQCAVRAAENGRILVLDGVEHAERNVLPILNNLLENREMHLENGKFLMHYEKYDKLLEKYNQVELDRLGLIRCSEDFRVIALGLPTQKYKGTPLDPPLRSRFQSRYITHLTFNELLSDLKELAPNVEENELSKLVSFALGILESDKLANLPDFPIDNLSKVAQILNNNKMMSVHDALYFLYPYSTILQKENVNLVKTLLKSLNISALSSPNVKNLDVIQNSEDQFQAILNENIIVSSGGKNHNKTVDSTFVNIDQQTNLIASILKIIAVGDICLVGQKGVGKFSLIKQVAAKLGQKLEPMVLYEDMTSRDLLQQRITAGNGDTIWSDSPLVRAAYEGNFVVLDGINCLHKSTTTILQRLIHDRELQLCDGKILLRSDRYNELLEKGMTKEDLDKKRITKIHDSFRILALAEPSHKKQTSNWLNPELLSLFLFLEVRPLYKNEEKQIIQNLFGKIDSNMEKILKLSQILQESNNAIINSLASTLSTRKILKIAQKLSTFQLNTEDKSKNVENFLYETIQNTFLAKFLPALPRTALEDAIKQAGITRSENSTTSKITISVNKEFLQIGSTKVKIENTSADTKIPNTLFYDVPQHLKLLERLLQDFSIGEHLLLVGNQGVGKNKLVDKLLQLLNKPREYIQLHRDTTVQTLTVQSTLRDGMVTYEDSPLVKAVKNGNVLVIDEADKAPVNVTCILRTLVKNGEMMLSDGRKIVPETYSDDLSSNNLIRTHPNFRIIALANRPGFPFLGNDFYASLGDVFSCHAIDNPDPDSEIFLLQQYGPSVPRNILSTLVNAFGELRKMADEGILNYPYSTREVVNIVKHLQEFPNESMSEVIGNILDFDKHSTETLEQVTEVLLKHGVHIENYAKNQMYVERKSRKLQLNIDRKSGLSVSGPKHGKIDPNNEPHVGGNTWAGGTGGRDTAGLGGKGGPYRLDANHDVHQLSDAEKDDIPDEVKRAAREMNRKAFEDKLKEIRMSQHDYKIYAQFSEPIRKQVQQLKAVLEALQTKSKERLWQKYQTFGEIDDTRLIEGITGEKNIYRRRTDVNPWSDMVQEKPKRVKLVVDVSGSMYRFNRYDGRLDRELEAVVMVMEAFEGYETKILYDIVGHSGEGYNIPFVNSGKAPKNDKERLETIKLMHAHSQYCWPGDHTLDATGHAIKTLEEEDNDDAIVIVLSDANLSRYNIQPRDLAKALTKGQPKIQGYCIFIGSLREEADLINSQMPAGHSYVCLDVKILPQILKNIFASSIQ